MTAPLSIFRLPVTERDGAHVIRLDDREPANFDMINGQISAFNMQGHSITVRWDSNHRHADSVLTERTGANTSAAAMVRERLREKVGRRTDSRLDKIRRADAASASSGFYFARELEYIYAQVAETPYPDMDGWTLFNRVNIDPGKKTHTFRRVVRSGDASLYVGGNDIPDVSAARTETSYLQHTIATSFSWDMFEAMASGDPGSDYVREGMTAADRALNEYGDHLIWHGSAGAKFYGVLNTPKLPVRFASVAFDGTASVDDVLAALNSYANHARIVSKGAMRPDSCVMGLRPYAYLAETRMGTVSDTTILEYWLRTNSAGIRSVEQSWHLDGTGTGGRCGILFYRKDAQTGIQNTIGAGFTMLPVQQQVFMNRVYFYMRLGGIVMRDVGNQLLAWVTCAAVN